MPKSFASDKHALGECARCGVKMLLKFMLNDGYYPNLIVCPSCWEPRHPQESLPNVEDPVTLYRPAPENLPAPTAPVLAAAVSNPVTRIAAVSSSGAAANGFRIATTDDFGRTWTARPTPLDANWFGIAYSPQLALYVAVASSGANRVMTSPDGKVWTLRNAAAALQWRSVAWSPALLLFVAVANTGVGQRVMTSPDGINWTLRNTPADLAWGVVMWVASFGLFIATTENTPTVDCVMTSPDGTNWTRRSTPSGCGESMAYSPTLNRVAIRSGSSFTGLYTNDGLTYTAIGAVNSGCRSMAFGAGRYVVLGPNDSNQEGSVDGITWTSLSVVDEQWLCEIFTAGSNEFLAISTSTRSVMVSSDGQAFTVLTNRMPFAVEWDDLVEASFLENPVANLDWTASVFNAALIKSYQLYRSKNVLPTDPAFADSFSLRATNTVVRAFDTTIVGDPTLYTDNDVADIATSFYHYYVVAIPVQGPSVRSNTVPLALPPTAVVLSAAYNTGPNRFDLSWTASGSTSTALNHFDVLRSINGGAFVAIATVGAAAPRVYSDTPVDRTANSYRYEIRAVDTIGVTSLSNLVSFPMLSSFLVAIAVTNTPRAMYSSDGGQSWTLSASFPLPASVNVFSCGLAFNGTRIVAVDNAASNSNIAYSDDFGVTWTLVNKGSNETLFWVVYLPWANRFIAGGYFDGVSPIPIMHSTNNGLTWNKTVTSGAANLQPAKNWWVVPALQLVFGWVGNALWKSSNGIDFTEVTAGFNQPHGETPSTLSGQNYDPVAGRMVWGGTQDSNFCSLSAPYTATVNSGFSSGASSNTPIAWSPTLGRWLGLATPGAPKNSYSPSGLAGSWSSYVPPADQPLDVLVWSPTINKYVAVGNRIAKGRFSLSTEGLTWVSAITPDNADTQWGGMIVLG